MHAATHLTPVSQTRLWAGRIMHAHLPEGEKIDVSPHVLRHTFLRKLAGMTQEEYAKLVMQSVQGGGHHHDSEGQVPPAGASPPGAHSH